MLKRIIPPIRNKQKSYRNTTSHIINNNTLSCNNNFIKKQHTLYYSTNIKKEQKEKNNTNGIKHVIWDWNGTLFDDLWLTIEVTNEMLSRRGMNLITEEKYRTNFTFPIREHYKKNLGFSFNEKETFEEIAHEWIDNYEERRLECNLHTEVISTLTQLEQKGITQSVLSAYKHDTLHELLDHYDVNKYFLDVQGHADVYAHSKEEQGIEAIKRLPYNSKEIIMIGDTLHDYDVANAMGTKCALLTIGHHNEIALSKASKVPKFSSLDQVLSFIIGVK